MHLYIVIFLIIAVALGFEFSNGFHDTSNAVATSIATKSLEPKQAIFIAAIFNLVGALSGTAVASTMIHGFANPHFVTHIVILSALVSAIIWNIITAKCGIPSSSSNALIGSLVGAIGANSGFKYVYFSTVLYKVLIPMVCSPVIGFILATIISIILTVLVARHSNFKKVNIAIREMQVFSTAFLSFSHGINDAQKTMGIITLTLFTSHLISNTDVPLWVIFVCAIAMGLGTLFGGIEVVKTLSTRVAKLSPINGFATEISSAIVLLFGARLGMPLSTTHAVSGAVMGAGSVNFYGINMTIVRRMIFAWIITIPMCICISYTCLICLDKLFGWFLRI